MNSLNNLKNIKFSEIFVLYFFVYIVLFWLFSFFTNPLIGGLAFEVAIFLIAIYLLKDAKIKIISVIKIKKQNNVIILLKLMLILILIISILSIVFKINPDLAENKMSASEYFLSAVEFLNNKSMIYLFFFSSCILAPISEEFFFRGLILNKLSVSFPKGKAILISSLIFGVLHFNFVQIISLTSGALLLSYIYLDNGEIFSPIFLHIIVNSYSFINSITANKLNLILFSIPYPLIACFILAGIIIYFLIQKYSKKYQNMNGNIQL